MATYSARNNCSRARAHRCSNNRVVFKTELDAKIALAGRIGKEKGEDGYEKHGNHFHLTSSLRKRSRKQNKGIAPA